MKWKYNKLLVFALLKTVAEYINIFGGFSFLKNADEFLNGLSYLDRF